eukprot:9442854-Karenia_brevis.AAC.1
MGLNTTITATYFQPWAQIAFRTPVSHERLDSQERLDPSNKGAKTRLIGHECQGSSAKTL